MRLTNNHGVWIKCIFEQLDTKLETAASAGRDILLFSCIARRLPLDIRRLARVVPRPVAHHAAHLTFTLVMTSANDDDDMGNGSVL